MDLPLRHHKQNLRWTTILPVPLWTSRTVFKLLRQLPKTIQERNFVDRTLDLFLWPLALPQMVSTWNQPDHQDYPKLHSAAFENF